MTDLAQITDDMAGRIRPKLNKPIVLVGMMGSGKSHAGSLLARALSVPHRDSDQIIEREERRKIADIFATDGEAAFRVLECEMIKRLLSEGICVISTGGGCLTVPETARAIKDQSISIWLNAPADVLYDRVKHARHRPLINCEDPQARLAALLGEREPLYAQADLVVDDPLKGVDALVLAILTALEGYLEE